MANKLGVAVLDLERWQLTFQALKTLAEYVRADDAALVLANVGYHRKSAARSTDSVPICGPWR